MAQYSYPGNQNNQRSKYSGCAPTRGGKSKRLEWVIMALFALDVFCQIMTQMAVVGLTFWWLGLGDSVLVLMLLMLLIIAKL